MSEARKMKNKKGLTQQTWKMVEGDIIYSSLFLQKNACLGKISENDAKCMNLDGSDWDVDSARQDSQLNLQCLLKCNVAFNRNYRSFEMRLLILPDASLQFLKPFNFQSFQTTIPHHHQHHRYCYN